MHETNRIKIYLTSIVFYWYVKNFLWNDNYGFCPHGADDWEARTGNKLLITSLVVNYCDNCYYGEIKEAWVHLSWEPGCEGPEEETNTPKLKGDKGCPDVEIKKMPRRHHQSSMGESSKGGNHLSPFEKELMWMKQRKRQEFVKRWSWQSRQDYTGCGEELGLLGITGGHWMF